MMLSIEPFTLPEVYPEAHKKYVVCRDRYYFTATPCYGLHTPLWVVKLMGDYPNYEAPPEIMKDGDKWWPLEEIQRIL